MRPDLFEYFSPTQYLQDLYAFRKSDNGGFSYESWAAELGFKSRSFLKMIISRERSITPHFIEVFCEAMSFSKEERTYFSLIVSHGQSDSDDEKSYYLDRLFEIKGQKKDLNEIINYQEFLSSKILPHLLVLLSFKDLDRRVETLASFLNEDTQTLQKNLETLERMGLANCENSIWISTKKSFKVPKDFGSSALEQYHNNSLNEAMLAQKKPFHERRFRSLLLPLSKEDYEQLVQDIESTMTKLVAKYDSDFLNEKRLYKLNLNFFPITATYQSDHNIVNETRLLEN